MLQARRQVAKGRMGRRTNLTGRYRVLNEASLREKAKRTFDPRHRFYQAMLSNETYEVYLAAVGDNRGPFSGRGEILYARHNGWIADDA
jgi:hypothetical protein